MVVQRQYGDCSTVVPRDSRPLTLASYFRIKDAHQKALYSRNGQLLVGDPDSENCSAGEFLLGELSVCHKPLTLFFSRVSRDMRILPLW